jgi:hypothetical protein
VAGRLDEARQVEQLIPGFLDLEAVEKMCGPRRTIIDLPDTSPVSAVAGRLAL